MNGTWMVVEKHSMARKTTIDSSGWSSKGICYGIVKWGNVWMKVRSSRGVIGRRKSSIEVVMGRWVRVFAPYRC